MLLRDNTDKIKRLDSILPFYHNHEEQQMYS